MRVPRVSVVMAVKDMPKRDLEAAMFSIVNQSMTDLEFIVVDYGSEADTLELLRGLARRDPRVLVIEYPGITFTQALNVGVAATTGNYIARQDADDMSHSDRLLKHCEVLDKSWMVDVLWTGHRVLDTAKGRTWAESFEFDHYHVELLLRYGCPIAHGTLMVRSKVFDQFDYDEVMHCAQDYGLYLKIMFGSHFPFYVIPDVLYTRWHTPECVSVARRHDQDMFVGYAMERYGNWNSTRRKRLIKWARAYWRTSSRVKKMAMFILIGLYDYRYWLAEWHKAKAEREYDGHY